MYSKINSVDVKSHDFYGKHNAAQLALLLSQLSFNLVTPALAAGASGATTKANVFVVPTKAKITKVTGIIDVVQTGADNTPKIQLLNLTQSSAVIAESGAIALAGTVGDKVTVTVDPDKAGVKEGDVLQLAIVNPTATITIALTAKAQIEWESVIDSPAKPEPYV